MKKLSYVAQSIMDEFFETPRDPKNYYPVSSKIAAVLRRVNEEVVLSKYQFADWEMAHLIHQEINKIADELDPYPDITSITDLE